MNYLETVLEFIYRIVRVIFGRKRKKDRPEPTGNAHRGTDCDKPAGARDEPAGSNHDGHRGDPDPLPPQTADPEPPAEASGSTQQRAVNLTGWCLIVGAGLSKIIGL